MISYPIAAAIISTFLFAFGDTISRRVSSLSGSMSTSLLFIGFGIVPMLLAAAFLPAFITPSEAVVSALSGALLALGYIAFYKTLETEQVSNVGVVSEIIPVVIIAFGILFLGERISSLGMVLMVVVLSGVLLATFNPGMGFNRKIAPAVLSAFIWAIYWLPISYMIYGSSDYVLPLLISRVSAFVLILAYFAISSSKIRIPKIGLSASRVAAYGLAGGIMDGTATLLFGFATHAKLLVVAAAITTITPIIIMAAAYFLFKERLTPIQKAGILVAVIGAIGLALI